ncbi:hypothetical protein PLESTF_001203400, partial [Pleodorina starrii]
MEKIGACKLPRRAARRIVEEPWGVSRQPVAQQLETLLLKIRDEQKRVCADNCAGLENLGVALGELTANAVAAVQAVRESLRKRTSEHRGSRIATRGDLSAELLRRIASFVPPNEVVCSLRRVDKFTLAQLSNWKPVVRLSQAVPHGAFIERWGSPEAMWDMTLQQRRQLLALTAASGSLANLQVAFEAAGCTLVRDMEDLLLEAAATGGSHGVCQWLLDKGCSPRTKAVELAAKAGHLDLVRFLLRHDPSPSRFGYGLVADAFAAAAGAGQRAVCEGLLAHVAEQWVAFSTWSAARGGHVDLAQWLLQQLPREGVMVANYQNRLLADAAFGFDLPSLQRLCLSLRNDGHLVSISRAVAAAAIAGPSPDWRAKYEWLRGEGIEVADDSIHLDGWDSFLGREDCTERLELLQQLGKMDHDEGVIDFAVRTANLPLLQYATVQGVWGRLSARHAEQAAGSGNVAFLAGLLAMGCPIGPGAAEAAARRGHLRVLQWLAGPEAGRAGAAVLADACLVECAPESGSVELMQLLRERGCPWDERVFVIAAASGNTAFVEWLASAGCPKVCVYCGLVPYHLQTRSSSSRPGNIT